MPRELIANMPGGRRVGVTKAVTGLQQRQSIHDRRGSITILDSRGLEAAA